MNKLIILFLMLGVFFISGCETTIIEDKEPDIINPVYIEKTITNVSIELCNIHCWDKNGSIVDDDYFSYWLDVSNDYITNSISDDWLKTKINYPVIRFDLHVNYPKDDIDECSCYGRAKIDIDSKEDGEYSTICRFDSDMDISYHRA